MSSASDISNLFQMLGVSPSHYQEIERIEQVQGSRGRWSMQTTSSPGDTTRDDSAREAEAVLPTDVTEVAPAAPPQLIAPAVPAAVSGSLPVLQAAPEQPVLQFNPGPVAAPQQPDSLSAVFARLRERSEPQEGVPQRQTS
ncbi:hypothetical protein F6X37_06685 [Paraburkholderia sp. 31.1]|uniref:BcsR/BcsP family cellulose biosynthesis protein n=1 Tax=Paraburkholderia sp. 31.1 TaxID=2615205 RepID=UPI00165609FD|nr:BcsR/BcsP family cellulose biosynthesis protein [Paraburkholderia sp. 31.1]MBC8721290.1 hypothetical protein [Paraburkholderia sp. 31.1]